MTGFYVRVLRDGRWQSIEIDQLSDKELDEFISSKIEGQEDGWSWVRALAIWVRDNVSSD